MKLFVWENVLYDYGPGIMFAHAETLEQALELLRGIEGGILVSDLGSPHTVIEADQPYANYSWGSS